MFFSLSCSSSGPRALQLGVDGGRRREGEEKSRDTADQQKEPAWSRLLHISIGSKITGQLGQVILLDPGSSISALGRDGRD